MEQGVLKKMLQQVIFACAAIDLKPILTGVLFETSGEKMRLCGCDGYRIALREENCVKGLSMDARFVVPAKSLQEVIRLLSDDDSSIRIELARRHIIFAFDSFYFFSRYVEGEYIDYAKSLPKEFGTHVKVDLAEAIGCFERCALLIDERAKSPIRLKVTPDGLNIQCTTANGKIEEEIFCPVEGEEMLVGFNNTFLLEALRGAAACGEEKVMMELNTPFSGMAITSPENDSFYYMVVPMRLN